MSTRISSLCLLSLLAACDNGPGDAAAAVGTAASTSTDELVWCSLGGAKAFAQECQLERAVAGGRPAFVVRHPDGKFRRLVASADGQNLLAADGADQTQSARKADATGERWEVILGDDRYVVPVAAPGATSGAPKR